jgi:tetratricopeptide (TPR) repeat protein
MLLWQRFADISEWQRTPDAAKRKLIAFGTEYDALLDELAENVAHRELPFGQMRRILEVGSSFDARVLAALAEEVASWAGRQGFIETAALYSLLAAHLIPRDPVLNYAAGRAERACARYHRAEQWFQRAIALARRAGDTETYASAYLGWGLMEEQRGRSTEAVRLYTRALRAAQRGGVRALAAAAHHNMIPLAAQTSSFDKGNAHVIAAYKLYGDDAALTRLAADAACFWAWFGYFDLAARVYDAVVDRIDSVPDKLQVLANLARALAALRREAEYERAVARIHAYDSHGRHIPPRVWVDLAEAARTLGRTRLALDCTGRAIEDAQKRGEQATLAAANQVLATIQAASPTETDKAAPERVQRFAARLTKRIRQLPASGES